MASASSQTPNGRMATAARTSRLPPAFLLPTDRDEDTQPYRNGPVANVWGSTFTHDRDASPATGGSTAQPWRRVSATEEVYPERISPTDPTPGASTSSFLSADDWGQNVWTSPFSGDHARSNSIGLPRTARTQPSPFAAVTSSSNIHSRSFDMGSRQAQQGDVGSTLSSMAGLSVDDRPGSNANNTGFNSAQQQFDSGSAAQGWPSNSSTPLRFFSELNPMTSRPNSVATLNGRTNSVTTLNGHSNSVATLNGRPNGVAPLNSRSNSVAALNGFQTTAQRDPPYTTNRSLIVDRASPMFVPGATQYTSHQDDGTQQQQLQLSSRDIAVSLQAERQLHSAYAANQAVAYNQTAQAWYLDSYFPPDFSGGLHAHPYGPGLQHALRNSLIQGYPAPLNPYLPGGTPVNNFTASQNHDPKMEERTAFLNEIREPDKPGGSTLTVDLKRVYGHAVYYSQDQNGSRFIQRKLETASDDEKSRVFKELKPEALILMNNVYGNYVIQKFFERGSEAQKEALVACMKGNFLNLSTQMYACRVVQTALEKVTYEQKLELVSELKPNILGLMHNQQGNHVVQKIVEVLERKDLDFIIEPMRAQIGTLSRQQFACRVVQRLMEHGTAQDRKDIFAEVLAAAGVLIPDEFGNYVVHRVLQLGTHEDKTPFIDLITPQVVEFSKHKYASNVVERCITYGSDDQVRGLRREFERTGPDGKPQLASTMKDQYGNYVIQKLLCRLVGTERESFVDEVRTHLESMKQGSYSKQVNALEDLLSRCSSRSSPRAEVKQRSTSGVSQGSPTSH